MSKHEFTEDVADGSMCVCGVPALGHPDDPHPAVPGDTRTDLLRRVREAHDNARAAAAGSRQASLDRGALIEALVTDGASYSEIGGVLGVSKMSVMRLLRRYQAARDGDVAPG